MLSKTQLRKIERIIRRRFRKFSMKTLGERALTEAEMNELKAQGLLPEHVTEYMGDAIAIGKISASLGPSATRALTYNQVLEFAKKLPQTDVERKVIQYATDHAGQYVKGIEDDMVKDVMLAATKTSAEVLRQTIAGAVEDRLTPSQLKSNLFHALDNRGRDWHRVASTELQNAIQTGIYQEIQLNHGLEQLCYKRPAPNACKHCKRLFLHADGTPKIFRLRDLETSNVGRRASEWKPTIEAVHPFCQCQLHVLPEGYGFEKRTVANESFEFDGHTYGKGAIIPDDVLARLTPELKKKTKLDAILTLTDEDIEPVSKAEINVPISEEDNCVCEY